MKSGIVTIIGRPSAGKSTFLNTACGEKVSIVSEIPQTTRNAIRGIVNTNKSQIVFIDTPGFHHSEKKLNLKLKELATTRIDEADAVLYLIDTTRAFGTEEQDICDLLSKFQDKLVVGLNKADKQKSGNAGIEKIFSIRQKLLEKLPQLKAENIFEVSALKDKGIENILSALTDKLPEGDQLYPTEFYTDQPVEFRIAEIIREQAILHTRQEIPHSLYVSIEDTEMRKNGKELWVRAFLFVERESQKSMVIGKGAKVIKSIRIKSMEQMRRVFPYKVQLDLQVRVNKNWRQKDRIINKLTD